jgi:hypothetical protein
MVLGVILGDLFGVEWAYLISVGIIVMVLFFSAKLLFNDETMKMKVFEEMGK